MKAQVAVEYLMTYGWAIFALVIVLGVIIMYTQGANQSVREDCIFPQQIICNSIAISYNQSNAQNEIRLNITNNFGHNVEIDNVKVTYSLGATATDMPLSISGCSADRCQVQDGHSKLLTTSGQFGLQKGRSVPIKIIVSYYSCPEYLGDCAGPFNVTGYATTKVIG